MTPVDRPPSSATAAHGRQHYCAAGLLRPLPDKYALAIDERIINISKQNDNAIV